MEDTQQISSAFDKDLAELNRKIAKLGQLTQNQFARALEALLNYDLTQIDEIVAHDKRIDELESKLNEDALTLIALRSPLAADLRRVIVAVKIATMLERMGDYAKNIAKRIEWVAKGDVVDVSNTSIKSMGETVQHMVQQVLEAYMNADADTAMQVWLRDVEVDQMHKTIFQELLQLMGDRPEHVTAGSHMLFITKNIERIGDYATGIAEQICFLVNGFMPEETRPKADETDHKG